MVHIKQIRGVPSYLSLSTPLTPQGDSVTQVITCQKTWTTSPGTNDRVSLAADVPGRFDSNGSKAAAVAIFGATTGTTRATPGFWGNAQPNGLLSWLPITTPVNQDFGRFRLANTRTATGDAWDPEVNSGVYSGAAGLIQYYAEFPALRTAFSASPGSFTSESALPAAPLLPGNLKLFARQGKTAYGYTNSPVQQFSLSTYAYSYPSGAIEEDIATYQRADVRYGVPQVAQIHVASLSPSQSLYPFVAPADVTVTRISLVGNTTLTSPALGLSVYNHAATSPGLLFAASPTAGIAAGTPTFFSPNQYQTMEAGDWLELSWAGSASPLTNLTISVDYQPIYPT